MSGIECPIECMKDSKSFIKDNETFLLTVVATVSGIIGLLLQSCLKSRCSEIKCFGLFCKREPLPPDGSDIAVTPQPITRNENV
jgi:hypothetical protein